MFPNYGILSSENSEGVQHYSRDFRSMKSKVILKDTGSPMPRFSNLRKNGMKRSLGRPRDVPAHENRNIVYSLCSNFSTPNVTILPEPKYFFDKIFYTQEKMSVLIDNTINYIIKLVLSDVDNGSYHFKDMIKQLDLADFIKAIEKEIDTHRSRSHWESFKRSDMPDRIKTIMSL